MAKISTLQCAYDYLKEQACGKSFNEIWEHVSNTLEIENPDEKVSSFYTNLTLDGRFVLLKNNTWKLREQCGYNEYHIPMEKYYSSDDEGDSSSDIDDENENGIDDDVEDNSNSIDY